MNYDVIVIGAGAAGMMCAAQAGQRGRRVLLIEHYHALGEKIRISGGGRCNFTNVNAGPANYLSRNPDFCRSALARYTPAHFLRMVERHGIAWHEKKLGQLFCDDTAVDVIRMLKDECDRGRVHWRMPCPVDGVAREGDRFVVRDGGRRCSAARRWSSRPAASPCRRSAPRRSATGSRSSSGWPWCRRARRWCRSRSRPTRSRATAICPGCRSTPRSRATAAGSARTCSSRTAGCRGRRSSRSRRTGTGGRRCRSTCCPGRTRTRGSPRAASRTRACRTCSPNACRSASRKRGAPRTTSRLPVRQLADQRLRDVAARLAGWEVLPSGTLGYNKAEVTLGGVDTRGLSSKTMEAHRRARPLTSSVKSSTSPAGSGATISSGHGHRGTRPAQFA